MTEEQLNENLIKSELQGICQDCIYLDKIVLIIRKMLSEEYKTGLEQSRFDKNMLERENQELKKQLEKKYEKVGTLTGELLYEENTKLINQQKEFIEWLEDMLVSELDIFTVVRVCDVLSKYKEIIGVKDE